MISKGMNDNEIREAMKKRGMKTIADRLAEMIEKGDTSYEEGIRVGLMDG